MKKQGAQAPRERKRERERDEEEEEEGEDGSKDLRGIHESQEKGKEAEEKAKHLCRKMCVCVSFARESMKRRAGRVRKK